MPTEILIPPSISPMQLIERAATENASIETLQQLFELKLRVEADEAKKAFNEAFTAFKGETFQIVRDKENTQYSKGDRKAMYTSLENMVATVTPFLSKHGLSTNWQVKQEGAITVTCTLTHVLGHSTSVTVSGPPDESGAKNKLQQIKSTTTYLKVATFENVCGLASAFGSTNDDGNGAGGDKMPEPDFVGFLDNIQSCETQEQLRRHFSIAYKQAETVGDKGAMTAFIAAKDKRKGELA